MDKRWFLHAYGDKSKVEELAGQLNISQSLADILLQRGVKTYDEARLFFRPTLEGIHNPFLMKNMEKSVERVEKAIASQEKILIFGDYDVDGISAVALMYSFLKEFVSKIEYYVPDRYGEGYGMSVQSVEYAQEQGFTLMIVLDCGIKCHQEIALANQYGIDVIVCDHHLPDETLPQAYAILDPKLPDCTYPCKDLSGCGVGFKLVQAISQKRNIPFAEIGKYMDLLALSVASDIVPITGENRTFTYFGLKLMNLRPRQAIESLLAFSKIVRKENPDLPPANTVFTKAITVNDLVFYVGPRINAAGRVATGRNSVHLLIAEKEDKILQLGELVDMHNSERRELDTKTTQEVVEMVSSNPLYDKKRSLVVYNAAWSKGIIGIVASRLVEHFYKPSIVLAASNDLITGSARSVKGFDLYAALCRCSGLLEHFGGHTFAAGLSLKPENLNAFIEKFEEIVAETIDENSIIRTVDIDAEIDLKDITLKFYEIVKNFAPFGPCNMAPVFMTKQVYDTGFARIVGQNHLKLSVFQKDCRSYPIDAIGFGLGQH
ncbi:MAG: single-stranded-DNA-specific exonuclease RecJ, partial [Lentimicrobiaceae bacterium]|nr:single-stranded-DNA-specific exonuclease RecJ [Lentimicrobiaceae bacterium]